MSEMPVNGIETKMFYWCSVFLIIELIQAENLFNTGVNSGFLVDPFLELTGGATTPPDLKSNKPEPACLNNGTLAVAIICTLLMSTFAAFLIWLTFLREKLQELRYYQEQEKNHIRSTSQHYLNTVHSSVSPTRKRRVPDTADDYNTNPLPLDVTDYKFGTFPFRQSQSSSPNGHYNHTEWLHRVPSSFRSVNGEQDAEIVDIELLDPTFCGLNFSITGNMRAGIFIKEILEKDSSEGCLKLNSSDQLRTGDRILALTVCFQSIVYEDALTILSYASPYPVILRVQRLSNSTKTHLISEKRPPSSKVKWRDDFEHYDNDTSHSRSFGALNPTMTLTTDTKPILPANQQRLSSKKTRSPHRQNEKSSARTGKTCKMTVSSAGVASSPGAIKKRSKIDSKKNSTKANKSNGIVNQAMLASTGLSAKPIDIIKSESSPVTNKATMKSVTNAVISYLHYKGTHGAPGTDVTNNSEGTIIPYYDSPYDYYYDGHNQPTHLNRNNNNSSSVENFRPLQTICEIPVGDKADVGTLECLISPEAASTHIDDPQKILACTEKSG